MLDNNRVVYKYCEQ